MKKGRNDLCICGSGNKYKKCCMNKYENIELKWRENFDKIDIGIDKKKELKEILFYTYDFMNKNDWQGACHALSAIQYILLSELGLNPKFCIGIVGTNHYEFDHSWIEVDDKVYDITIANGLNGIKSSEPIIAGLNIDTLQKTEIQYGKLGELDFPANVIKNITISDYIDDFSRQNINEIPIFLRKGLWSIVLEFLRKIDKDTSIEILRKKYSNIKRTIV